MLAGGDGRPDEDVGRRPPPAAGFGLPARFSESLFRRRRGRATGSRSSRESVVGDAFARSSMKPLKPSKLASVLSRLAKRASKASSGPRRRRSGHRDERLAVELRHAVGLDPFPRGRRRARRRRLRQQALPALRLAFVFRATASSIDAMPPMVPPPCASLNASPVRHASNCLDSQIVQEMKLTLSRAEVRRPHGAACREAEALAKAELRPAVGPALARRLTPGLDAKRFMAI